MRTDSQFQKLSDPEYVKQMEIERNERERIYQEKETIRKKTVCFTGHRPNKLGGYDMKNPTMLKLKDKLLEVIEELINKENKSRFITGGALGTDQICLLVCTYSKEEIPSYKKHNCYTFQRTRQSMVCRTENVVQANA